MLNVNLVKVDIRIIKEVYRNYALIAQYWDGKYCGKITKDGQVVADSDGDNLDSVIQNLRTHVDELIEFRLIDLLVSPPNVTDYSIAFRQITHILSLSEKEMLSAHSNATNRRLSLNELRTIGGFSSTVETFLCYVAIANRLSDELGCVPTTRYGGMDPALCLLLQENRHTAPSFPPEDEALILRKDVRDAVREQFWLK